MRCAIDDNYNEPPVCRSISALEVAAFHSIQIPDGDALTPQNGWQNKKNAFLFLFFVKFSDWIVLSVV